MVWHRKAWLGQFWSPLSAWLTCPSPGTNHCRHCGEGPLCSSPQTHPSNPSPPPALCIYCSENRDYSQALILPPLETFLVPQAGHGISSPGPWLPEKGPWDPQFPFPKTSLRVSQDLGWGCFTSSAFPPLQWSHAFFGLLLPNFRQHRLYFMGIYCNLREKYLSFFLSAAVLGFQLQMISHCAVMPRIHLWHLQRIQKQLLWGHPSLSSRNCLSVSAQTTKKSFPLVKSWSPSHCWFSRIPHHALGTLLKPRGLI